ncbi:KIF17 protein, partial [Callaeas wilsoni]|nr:KIF17 protein [Callaeas wilsoni]
LQMLEQQVARREQAQNKDLKEKQKRRKKYADERRLQLVAALQESNEDSGEQALLSVYDSIQEEVRAKSKMLEKLRAAETEIRDLQLEFGLEKMDYLSTIRRQEQDLMLCQQLLDQVQSFVWRDCNYSNLEKIRRESVWDEESGCWRIPEPVIQKTHLPAAVPAPPQPKPTRTSRSNESGETAVWPIPPPFPVCHLQPDEDHYRLVLDRSDSETIASNYFRSRRASQML